MSTLSKELILLIIMIIIMIIVIIIIVIIVVVIIILTIIIMIIITIILVNNFSLFIGLLRLVCLKLVVGKYSSWSVIIEQ